jgi:DNA (cytosine-5)-methyltransferase 1
VIQLVYYILGKMKILSLFCGVGGSDLGMVAAGHEIIHAIDNHAPAIEIYRRNHPTTPASVIDLSSVDVEWLRSLDVDCVIGSPPCQGFSVMGKGDVSDPRNNLVNVFFQIVAAIQPRVWMMENVPNILDTKYSEILNTSLCLVDQYMIRKRIVECQYFGIPQSRKRVIFVGRRDKSIVSLIDETYTPMIRVGDAIADIDITPDDEDYRRIKPCEYSRGLNKIFGQIKPGIWSHDRETDIVLITGMKKTTHTIEVQNRYDSVEQGGKDPVSWAYKLHPKKFANTIKAGVGSLTALRHIHYREPRVITVREAARLQSFPDWYNFGTSKLQAHKGIGNSVPPLLAYRIGKMF